MRQAIRALGWATNVFWIILLFFTVTAVYSAFQLRPGFGEPHTSSLDGTITVSLPFYLYNGGFYDISDMNLTTHVRDEYGSSISDSSTIKQLIPRGSNVSITHNMSISVSQMVTENLAHLLFNDSLFDVGIALKLNYASAVPFQISTNFTMPWGAPLSNLTVGNISLTPINATHAWVDVPISFENHSFLELSGAIRLEIVDNMNQVMSEGTTSISAPPQSGPVTNTVRILVEGTANIREVRLYFQTTAFNYGPVVISLV